MEDTIIEDVLKTFENYYVKKDFSNALLTLQKHKQVFPPDLWHYNTGTVHAKLENWAQARYHLLMAERSGLSEPELEQNLAVVEEKLDVEKLERPLDFTDYAYKYASAAANGAFTALGLLILLIGLLVLRKKASLWKLLVLTLLVLAPLAGSWWIRSWPRAIVSSPQLVREGPSQIFAERQELPAGVLVIYRGEGEWKEIRWPSRYEGWVKKSSLLELE